MSIFKAIILGAVQGLTEFLPVSSSGHLLLAERWLGVNTDGGLFFDIMLHIGTLLPVFIVFYKSIKGLFRPPYKTLLFLGIASIPAGITGYLFQDAIERLYKGGTLLSAMLLAVSFFVTATELMVAEKICKKNKNALPLSAKSSIIMGVFQGFAIIPAVSRSGTVITGGLIAGLDREKCAEFAFLMSIPVILGASLASSVKVIKSGIEIEILPVIFGIISAAAFGYIAVNATLKAVKKGKYKGFAIYLVALGMLSVLTKLLFGV